MTEYTSKSDNKHKEPEFDSTQKNNNNNKKTNKQQKRIESSIQSLMWKSLLPSLAG